MLRPAPSRLLVAAVTAAGCAAAPVAAQDAAAAPAEGSVAPGAMTFTEGAQCTANFVFTDAAGDVFLGQAAHCAGTGEATETDGCTSTSLPLGTPVEVEGASQPGTLAYSSWIAMQQAGETDAEACAYNDFALVRLAPDDAAAVDPSVPFFGGPTGLDTDGTATGETVSSYGNSSLRGGVSALSPKTGKVVEETPGGWSRTVYTATPGIPGDSGSGFLSADGTADGVLSTVALAPLAGSNGVSDLDHALDYAAEAGTPVRLVEGAEPFTPVLP